MSIKYHLVEPGMTLYRKGRQKMGNTSMRRDVLSTYVVIAKADRGCTLRDEHGRERVINKREIERMSRNKPTIKPDIFERARLAAIAKAVPHD